MYMLFETLVEAELVKTSNGTSRRCFDKHVLFGRYVYICL